MPRYTYRCSVCLEYFEASHAITEKLTDCQCGEKDSLKRIPSVPYRVSSKAAEPAGQMVKEFIDDAKKEIEKYKKDMSKGVDDV